MPSTSKQSGGISMTIITLISLAAIGLAGGFMAGLVGIGGGIVIIPLLVYVGGLPVNIATGISMIQAFFATLSGLVVHRKKRTVDVRLGVLLGATGVIGAAIGSFGSKSLSDLVLLTVYFVLVVVAVILMFMAPRGADATEYKYFAPLAGALGLIVGVLAGMLGVGGGFIMTPLMISVMRIPTRVAVGTSLLMILPTTMSGSIGKIATGQVDFSVAAIVIVGSIIGAQVGGRANSKVSPSTVRLALTVLLIVILLRTGVDLAGRYHLFAG